MDTFLHIGGLVAAGFDLTGEYLLTISHSGRGLFSTKTWQRLARDETLSYPVGGVAIGIGPIAGQAIPVTEMNFEIEDFSLTSPDGGLLLSCESDGITIGIKDR